MKTSSQWRSVESASSVERLVELAAGFEDALTISSIWQGAEYLDPSGNAILDGYGNLYLSLVSQFPDIPSLELRFQRVRSFRYDYEFDFELEVEFGNGWINARLLNWEIQAEKLDFCEAGE